MKRGTPEHPKMAEFSELLGRRIPECVGYLELLWHFAAKFTPEGDIGRYSDKRIESACQWNGRSGGLIEALRKSSWIDEHKQYRLLVHDWEQHADDSVRKRLKRVGSKFYKNETVAEKVTGHCPDRVRQTLTTVPDNGGLPESRIQNPDILPPPDKPAGVDGDPCAWFSAEYPGEVPDNLWQNFGRWVRSADDIRLLQENLPLWKATRKYQEGYAPGAIKFLRDGYYRKKPPPELAGKANGTARLQPQLIDTASLKREEAAWEAEQRLRHGPAYDREMAARRARGEPPVDLIVWLLEREKRVS
jgi:hypothetical protein